MREVWESKTIPKHAKTRAQLWGWRGGESLDYRTIKPEESSRSLTRVAHGLDCIVKTTECLSKGII